MVVWPGIAGLELHRLKACTTVLASGRGKDRTGKQRAYNDHRSYFF